MAATKIKRITKAHVGDLMVVTWKDPRAATNEDIRETELYTWTTLGVLHSIDYKKKIIRLQTSWGENDLDDGDATLVHKALITETIIIETQFMDRFK